MAKYCANCGTNLPQGAQFCPGCGQSVSQTREETTEQSPTVQRPGGSSGLLIGLGVLVAVLAIGLIAAFAYPLLTIENPAVEAEPSPEAGPNKQEVALEEDSLRDLVQEQVGDFELQEVDDVELSPEYVRQFSVIEALEAEYEGPGSASLMHLLSTTRSPEAADNYQQHIKDSLLEDGTSVIDFGDEQVFEINGLEVIDERPVEANEAEVGTLTVMQGDVQGESGTMMFWNNGNLLGYAAIEGESDAAESFYESVPY